MAGAGLLLGGPTPPPTTSASWAREGAALTLCSATSYIESATLNWGALAWVCQLPGPCPHQPGLAHCVPAHIKFKPRAQRCPITTSLQLLCIAMEMAISASNACLLPRLSTTRSVNLCAFTYVVVAVSLAASVTLFITQVLLSLQPVLHWPVHPWISAPAVACYRCRQSIRPARPCQSYIYIYFASYTQPVPTLSPTFLLLPPCSASPVAPPAAVQPWSCGWRPS